MRPSDQPPLPPLAPDQTSTVAVTWRPLLSAPATLRSRALVYSPGRGVHRVRFLMRRADGVVCGTVDCVPHIYDLRDEFTHWAADPHPVNAAGARQGTPGSFVAVYASACLLAWTVACVAVPPSAPALAVGVGISAFAALVAGFAVSGGAR